MGLSGAAGALTPPGAGPDNFAGAKAPPGAGSGSSSGAKAPLGSGPVTGARPCRARGQRNEPGPQAPPEPSVFFSP